MALTRKVAVDGGAPCNIRLHPRCADILSVSFTRVNYDDLNSRQQENFNFAKLAGVLAEYGFTALRLSDDWKGADLIAVHIEGDRDIKVQLKGRLTFERKYLNKNLWVAFRSGETWYLYDHDALFERIRERIEATDSWREHGGYSWPGLPVWASGLLDAYRL